MITCCHSVPQPLSFGELSFGQMDQLPVARCMFFQIRENTCAGIGRSFWENPLNAFKHFLIILPFQNVLGGKASFFFFVHNDLLSLKCMLQRFLLFILI